MFFNIVFITRLMNRYVELFNTFLTKCFVSSHVLLYNLKQYPNILVTRKLSVLMGIGR